MKPSNLDSSGADEPEYEVVRIVTHVRLLSSIVLIHSDSDIGDV